MKPPSATRCSPPVPPANPGHRLEPVRVLITEPDRRRARQQAQAQYEHSRELGWRDKSFSEKYDSGSDPVYFGELGEIAVERTFDRLELPYVCGLKSGVTKPEDITHDFYVAGKGIGVKTEVQNWCGSPWEFARKTRFGCIYTVRTPESGYGGSHVAVHSTHLLRAVWPAGGGWRLGCGRGCDGYACR